MIDACARRIVGWRVSRTAHAGLVLDALEQALPDRRPARGGGLVHHSDRGSQHLSIRGTERLLEAGIEPSVGSVGDSYDNALAGTVNGLFKTGVVRRRGPWRSVEAVELATLAWVAWLNHRRLLEPIGDVPPAEAEARCHAELEATALAAWHLNEIASGEPGAVQRATAASRAPRSSQPSAPSSSGRARSPSAGPSATGKPIGGSSGASTARPT